MSTIKCQKCNGTVAIDAERCPHCGTPAFSKTSSVVSVIQKLCGLGLGIALLYLAYNLWLL